MISLKSQITQKESEVNRALLIGYMNENHLDTKHMEQITGLSKCRIYELLAGRYAGTVGTWQAIKEATKLDIIYHAVESVKVPARNENEKDVFLFNYVIKHLIEYGNVFVSENKIKLLGGQSILLEALGELGYPCELEKFKQESVDYVLTWNKNKCL